MSSLSAHDHRRRVLRIEYEIESLENGFVGERIVSRCVIFCSEVEESNRMVFEKLLAIFYSGGTINETESIANESEIHLQKKRKLTSSRSDLRELAISQS